MNDAMLLWNSWHEYGGWGPGPWWWGISTVLFFAAIVAIGIFLSRRRPGAWGSSFQAQDTSAERVLAERFAKGDITEDEYVTRLNVLRDNRGR